MIKAVIVDDEANICEAVARMIRTCCPNVTIVAMAEGVKSGVGAINEHEADLVITDICLDDGSFLVMMDGACVPVASRKKDMLMELFKELE